MKELKQKRLFFFSRNYSIVEDGVKFISNTFKGYAERTIKFEDIEFDEQIFDESTQRIKVILACSLMFNILFVVATISSGGVKNAFENLLMVVLTFVILGIIVFLLQKERNKFLVGRKNIHFWYENNYIEKVDAFIKEIRIAKKEYMRGKYLKASDWEDEYTIKSKFNWLHDHNYINEEELQDWLLDLGNRKIINGK